MRSHEVSSALAVTLCALGALFAAPAAAFDVVTTTEDLASITREVAGDKAKVESLAKGYQDPHYVEAKPSFILKLHAAELLIVVGRGLEAGWLPPLIQQSRNPKIQPGAAGYLDASQNVHILEIPTGVITRAMGDVHPEGNPHYWLDPANGRRVAQAVRQKLEQLSPGDAAYFAARYTDFDRRLAEAEKRWDTAMAPYRGLKVITYHRSWPNFCERFGLEVVGYVEPRPGIPPSPSHTLNLIQEMKRQRIKLLLVEPYFDLKTPNAIARETGARVVVLLPSAGGAKGGDDYITLFDYNIQQLLAAIRETGAG